MIIFDARADVKNKRRVLLKGRVVTIIDLAGRKARIAEDGQWYPHTMFFPLTEESILQDHIDDLKSNVAGKSIATLKSTDTGVQLVLEDNTRLDVSYSKDGEGLTFCSPDCEKMYKQYWAPKYGTSQQ